MIELLLRANPGRSAAAIFLASSLLHLACNASKKGDSYTVNESASKPGLFTVSQQQLAHLRVGPPKKTVWSTNIQTTGTVDWDADHTTQAITQVGGPISRILVDTGSRVAKGDPLLYVASPDVANAISTYKKAKNRQTLAKRVLDRSKEMLDHGAIAVKDFESAQADFNDAGTDVQNSLQTLKIFDITRQALDQAEVQGVAISPELAVRAPIAGSVVQKLVMPGQLIQAGTTVCFVISDTSTVWVQGHIFDRDLPSVRLGDHVAESNASFPERFQGEVSYIGASLDPDTRTTAVRVVTRNPAGLLKKDMFVEAVIHTRTQNNILTVPVSAVLRDDKNEPIVYLEVEPEKFAQRPVTIGAQQNGEVQILSGLGEDDKVVSDGSIFLQFATTFQ
jgi:cobalt-zinc-cadmium efflux system membrane fusion protein